MENKLFKNLIKKITLCSYVDHIKSKKKVIENNLMHSVLQYGQRLIIVIGFS